MSIVNAATLVHHARANGYAVAQVNTNGATYALTRAVCEAAEELKAPLILGAYEANLQYRGYEYVAMQMRFFAERAGVPLAIHLDHGSTPDACKKAIDAGFTSVMIDGSTLPIDENLRQAKEVVALAGPHNVSVEAEVGQLQKLLPDGSMSEVKNLSDPNEVARMSRQAGVDMLAVGIGNAHGFYKGQPDIRFDVLERCAEACTVPLVLHGSTGLADSTIRKCIGMGMAKVNLGTLIRTRCVEFMAEVIAENKHLNHAWRVDEAVKDRIKPLVRHIIEITGSAGRAEEIDP